MDIQLINEIRDSLPRERTVFRYCKDGYAPQVLSYVIPTIASIATIKQSRFGKLLNKPIMQPVLQGCGNGKLEPSILNMANDWQSLRPYTLSLSHWDGCDSWGQTSRHTHNLVLQLNFSNQHDQGYRRLRPSFTGGFNSFGHPSTVDDANGYPRENLAWARLDFSDDLDEVLIEEIQSDWIRKVKWQLEYDQKHTQKIAAEWATTKTESYFLKCTIAELADYTNKVLARYAQDWAEAMLAATLHFIRQEIGCKTVWYHDWETGNVLKNICYGKPPKSLYTQLPNQFCFSKTHDTPAFLLKNRNVKKQLRKITNPAFQQLVLT